MEIFEIEAIGRVQGGRTEPEDDDWGASRATIALDPSRFVPDALLGLDQFSHAEIVFVFDRVGPDEITASLSTWPRSHTHKCRTGRRFLPAVAVPYP